MPANDGLRLRRGSAIASIPARAAATSPKTIFRERQTLRRDAVFQDGELLPKSQIFQEQVAARAKNSMDENRCRNSRSTCQCYTRTGRSDLADHPIDSRPNIIDGQYIQSPGTCFQKGDSLDNSSSTNLGFAWQSASWLKPTQPLATSGSNPPCISKIHRPARVSAAGFPGLPVRASAPGNACAGASATPTESPQQDYRNRDCRDSGELRRIEGRDLHAARPAEARQRQAGTRPRRPGTKNDERRLSRYSRRSSMGLRQARPTKELQVLDQGTPAFNGKAIRRQVTIILERQTAVENGELARHRSGGLSACRGEEG